MKLDMRGYSVRPSLPRLRGRGHPTASVTSYGADALPTPHGVLRLKKPVDGEDIAMLLAEHRAMLPHAPPGRAEVQPTQRLARGVDAREQSW